MPIYDNHNRPITYLRLAVTDRCNLRCFYCMPENGVQYLPKKEILSFEEMERLVRLVAPLGIHKLRITGGEPFVRKELMPFLARLAAIPGIDAIHLTTNGVLTAPHVPALKALGIRSVNLSIDSLDEARFFEITRRNELKRVLKTLDALLEVQIPTKLNVVVMADKNDQDILPMVALTKDLPLEVRFIEEMPFNGEGQKQAALPWDYQRIIAHIRAHYPSLQKIADEPFSTAYHYAIDGHQGKIGVIAAFSRTFCGTCNRIRLTAQGTLKTCLYDEGVLNIRDWMRQGASDEQLTEMLLKAFSNRPKDGFEAEAKRDLLNPVHESMSAIGG